jgi:hypothetical protein
MLNEVKHLACAWESPLRSESLFMRWPDSFGKLRRTNAPTVRQKLYLGRPFFWMGFCPSGLGTNMSSFVRPQRTAMRRL